MRPFGDNNREFVYHRVYTSVSEIVCQNVYQNSHPVDLTLACYAYAKTDREHRVEYDTSYRLRHTWRREKHVVERQRKGVRCS